MLGVDEERLSILLFSKFGISLVAMKMICAAVSGGGHRK